MDVILKQIPIDVNYESAILIESPYSSLDNIKVTYDGDSINTFRSMLFMSKCNSSQLSNYRSTSKLKARSLYIIASDGIEANHLYINIPDSWISVESSANTCIKYIIAKKGFDENIPLLINKPRILIFE